MRLMHAGSIDVWRFVCDRLRRRKGVALLVVVQSKGSAPGKTGFKMAVGADGKLAGTIGGGKIEYDTVEEARRMLRGKSPRAVVRVKVHHLEHPQTSGMICGGRQTVLIYPCRTGDLPAVESLLNQKPGTLRISRAGVSLSARQLRGRWIYTEKIRPPDTLYIVGGGHVGLALSRVMSALDFRIVVFDTRPDVETLAQNVFAHEKRVMPFAEVGPAIPAGTRSYAVIMTPSHAADELVLRQLVHKRLRYLGLMASRRKARLILGKLRAEGCPDKFLQNVHSPVGLPIASHTPAEIAISIAAEIIQLRNS